MQNNLSPIYVNQVKDCSLTCLDTKGLLSYFNPLNTPAVSNIEGRYSSGGGSPNGQTATSTTRGKKEQVYGNQDKHTGVGTPEWEDKIGGQKPDVSNIPLLYARPHRRSWDAHVFYVGAVASLVELSHPNRLCRRGLAQFNAHSKTGLTELQDTARYFR